MIVDPIRCKGHGICTLKFAERIDLDKWGYAVIDSEPFEEERLMKRAQRAVAACPEQALSIDD